MEIAERRWRQRDKEMYSKKKIGIPASLGNATRIMFCKFLFYFEPHCLCTQGLMVRNLSMHIIKSELYFLGAQFLL